MTQFLREIFAANRIIVLFVYGQAFFVLALAIALRSWRHSRLALARSLRWLAAFGFTHALYEWGDVFIPLQQQYMPTPLIDLLRSAQSLLLAISFACLFQFGIEALRPLPGRRRWPAIQVLMLTSFADEELVLEAISAGAAGYVLKQLGTDDLLRAVRAVGRGDAVLDPAVTRQLLARVRHAAHESHGAAFHDLSARELAVLALVAEGKTNADIAEALVLSEKTARNHVSTILEKLGLTNRIEAATYAVRHHIEQFVPER